MNAPLTRDDASAQLEGTVAHIGGGRSARFAAVAVAVVLGLVVWVGASGRPPTPVALPSSEAVQVAEGSDEPDASPASTTRNGPQTPDDVFGISVFMGLRGYTSILDENEFGHLTGEIHIPLPLPEPAEEAKLMFQQFSAPWAPGRPVQIGEWSMSVQPLATISDKIKLIVNKSVTADARAGDVPRPQRDGFWIRAGLHTESGMGTVEIDVRVGPNQQLLARSDDLFGPTGNDPNSPVVAIRPARVDYPRDRGLYNRCRWDISPYSGKPIPGTDEADC